MPIVCIISIRMDNVLVTIIFEKGFPSQLSRSVSRSSTARKTNIGSTSNVLPMKDDPVMSRWFQIVGEVRVSEGWRFVRKNELIEIIERRDLLEQ